MHHDRSPDNARLWPGNEELMQEIHMQRDSTVHFLPNGGSLAIPRVPVRAVSSNTNSLYETPPTPKDSSQITAEIRSAMQFSGPSTVIDSFPVTFEEQSARPPADRALASPFSIPAEIETGRQRQEHERSGGLPLGGGGVSRLQSLYLHRTS